jgi:hypothetical protein
MMATGSTADGVRSVQTLLGIYLNGHLAGDTGGLELARRAAPSYRGPILARGSSVLLPMRPPTVLRCGA